MTAIGWFQILAFALVILALTRPLGVYMFRVFEGEHRPLPRVFGPVERFLLRLCGVDEKKEQTWVEYTASLLVFSADRRAGHLRDPAAPARPALEPAAHAGGGAGVVVQHGGQLHHQHELAGLRRRGDDELPDPDGGAGLAQLHLGGGRHRRRPGAGPRSHPQGGRGRTEDPRQLLGRCHPRHGLRAAADLASSSAWCWWRWASSRTWTATPR